MADASPIRSAAVRERPRTVRDISLDGPEGTVLVSRAAYGQETEEVQKIRVPVFSTAPARVRVEGSVTRNLGDYNSARVAVVIEMPCYPEESEVRRVYNMVSGWLDEMIPEELAKATAGTEEENV